MPSYIIAGIHGLNNKPPEDRLKAWWIQAIAEGLRRNFKRSRGDIEFELVYWADLMYKALLESDPGTPDPDPLKYDLAPYTEAEGSGMLPQHDDSFRRRATNLLKEAFGGTIDKTTALPGVSRVADEVVERKARDLYDYYKDPDSVRQRLSDALRAAHDGSRRIMLIAHSMGSIVAFEVLSAIEREVPGLRVQHFVTVGSPLGLHEVKERIRAAGFPLRVPETVEEWTNFADRKDKVALDTWLHTDYGSNSRGIGVADRLVINGYVSPRGKASHHKIYGYLRAPEVSQAIDELIAASRD